MDFQKKAQTNMHDSATQTIPKSVTNSSSSLIPSEEHSSRTEISEWYRFLSDLPEINTSDAAHHLREAYVFGSRRSDDPRTQTSAVIVSGNSKAFGTNRLPGAVKILAERLTPENKGRYLIHAERDAVCSAAAHGVRTARQTMYAPYACCEQCAHAIIGAGLHELVIHSPVMRQAPARWRDTIKLGLSLCLEAGIRVQQYPNLLEISSLFDGKHMNF